jgi:hypothetical protein
MRKLAYILASSHSGSTLLAMLLGAHPELCTIGEVAIGNIGNPDGYRCSCGALIKKCPFWRSVDERMLEKGLDFSIENPGTNILRVSSPYVKRLLRPLHRGRVLEAARDLALSCSGVWRGHLKNTQKRNCALLDTLCQITGATTVVDSSKVGIRLKYLLRNREIDVRVVRLIRDGRAVSLTYKDPYNFADAKNPALRAGGSGGDRDREKKNIRDAAYEWRRSNEEAELAVARLKNDRYIEIRYEDLCLSTDLTLKGIYRFLGVSSAAVYRDFRAKPQHVIGNGMRLDTTSQIQLDERWKTSLSEEDRALFDTVAGTLNRKYGYV